MRQYPGREQPGKGEHDQCHDQQEINSLIEDGANHPEVALPVTAGNQNLRADAEAETQHEDGQIVHSCNGRGAQLHFAHTPHEGRIGHADKLFHNQADKDGVGHLPYFSVGIFGMHNRLFLFVGMQRYDNSA